MGRRSTFVFAALAVASLAVASLAAAVGGGATPAPRAKVRPGLANRCVTFAATDGRYVVARGESGYGVDAAIEADADAFHLKPTGTGTYLIQGPNRALMAAGEEEGTVVHAHLPTLAAEWALHDLGTRGILLFSPTTNRFAAVDGSSGALVLAAAEVPPRFDVAERKRCARYPEARVGARGKPARTTNRDGTVFGYADAHMHVTANLRAGGRVIHGQPFHPYGLPEALGHDEDDHGPDGSLDVTGNLLRGSTTHDTHGWPTFAGWPVHDTYTHQQAYHVWIERAWRAGLRLLVAQAVEDTALCELQPQRSHSCDETDTVKLAIAQLRALEGYVDAQAGGPGRGWFRIVTNPRQARRVIEDGKLAVLIGMETSSPLGCEEVQGEPQCTREDIDRVLGELHALGVRSIFVAHWTDNAYSGAALQSGAQGEFIGIFQQMTTGHPFATQPCGEADEADGTCNSKGFTDLGRYLLERMMAKHMLIEADHLSQAARSTVLDLAEANDYPLASSHTNTGGEWTPEQLQRLHALGGIATATPETAPEWAQKINRLRAESGAGRRAGIALGSDTGGFAALPGPRPDAATDPLAYPFTSHDGAVRFQRQRTGERTYDLNADGVAHYGLFPDLIADVETRPGGKAALRSLFRSAEAYLRMWELTY